jgi:hypothetical protein
LVNGPVPKGMEVCHHCDNPPCCNVKAHLFLGTHADNLSDMSKKGRIPHGSTHHRAKLTEQDVTNIRREYAEGDVSQAELSRRYGIQSSPMCKVIHRKSWRHVS